MWLQARWPIPERQSFVFSVLSQHFPVCIAVLENACQVLCKDHWVISGWSVFAAIVSDTWTEPWSPADWPGKEGDVEKYVQSTAPPKYFSCWNTQFQIQVFVLFLLRGGVVLTVRGKWSLVLVCYWKITAHPSIIPFNGVPAKWTVPNSSIGGHCSDRADQRIPLRTGPSQLHKCGYPWRKTVCVFLPQHPTLLSSDHLSPRREEPHC